MRIFLFAVMLLAGPVVHGFPQYYDISEHDRAQAEARQRNLPLAWEGGYPEDLSRGNLTAGSQADLEQMAMATLQGNAVVIFFDGRNMAPVPDIVHAQFHLQDDGPLANGANWVTPKVVFTNPEVTQILGRVSAKEMGEERDVALNSALQVIRNNRSALAPPAPVVSNAPASDAPVIATTKTGGALTYLGVGLGMMDFLGAYGIYVAIGVLVLIGLFWWMAAARRAT